MRQHLQRPTPRLTEGYRKFFTWCLAHRKTCEQVAQEFGIPYWTVMRLTTSLAVPALKIRMKLEKVAPLDCWGSRTTSMRFKLNKLQQAQRIDIAALTFPGITVIAEVAPGKDFAVAQCYCQCSCGNYFFRARAQLLAQRHHKQWCPTCWRAGKPHTSAKKGLTSLWN